MGCALAAPTPYDNPTKTGTVQEISKYHVTGHTDAAVHEPTHDKPAVVPAPHLDKADPQPPSPVASYGQHIEGPTPVSVHHKREADHHEEAKKKDEEKKLAQPSDFKRTTGDVKTTHGDVATAKRESVHLKEEEKPQGHAKVPTEHLHHDSPCDSACAKKHDHQHKREAASNPATTEVNTKVTVVHAKLTKETSVENKEKKTEEGFTTAKAIVKREDSTTEKVPASTTAAHSHHLAPTAVHSSFSHTWTRPQSSPAVEAQKDEEKVPAASDFKPVVATIDPFKPFSNQAHASSTTSSTTTTAAPSTTHAAGHRVRRGNDETEEQDQEKEPKPTKPWWRSLSLNKKEEAEEKKKPENAAPVVRHDDALKKPVPVVPSVAVAEVDKKDKVTQKRETVTKDAEEQQQQKKQPADGTSTQKPNRQLEQGPTEFDNKPPQFIHPVPVAQILGQKQV